jgi:chorismate synthase
MIRRYNLRESGCIDATQVHEDSITAVQACENGVYVSAGKEVVNLKESECLNVISVQSNITCLTTRSGKLSIGMSNGETCIYR